VIWPALAAVIVNLIGSLILVRHVGIVGVFMATLFAGPFVVVPLLRSALVRVHVPFAEFWRDGVQPVLLPAVAVSAVVAALAQAPLGDVSTLFVGGAVGLIVYVMSVFVHALDDGERRALRMFSKRVRKGAIA
jgi:hypothetical protein